MKLRMVIMAKPRLIHARMTKFSIVIKHVALREGHVYNSKRSTIKILTTKDKGEMT